MVSALMLHSVGELKMTKEITNDKDFQEWVLDSKDTVVVDFWAAWCGPCLSMAPVFMEIELDMNLIKFYKINVDDFTSMAQKYMIMSIPSFIIFKDGEIVSQRQGGGSKDDMVTWINDNIQ